MIGRQTFETQIRFGPDQRVWLYPDGDQIGPLNRWILLIVSWKEHTVRVCGSGFFLCPGVVLTARHVVEDAADGFVNGSEGLGVMMLVENGAGGGAAHITLPVLGMTASGHPGEHDLALLTTAVPYIGEAMVEGMVMPMTFSRPREKTSVLAFGYPQANGPTITKAAVFAPLTATQGTLREVHAPKRDTCLLTFPVFRSDYPSPHGMSGGPVVNEEGLVCGVVASAFDTSDERISYASLLAPALRLAMATREDGEGKTLYELCEEGTVSSDGSHRLYGG